MPKTLLLADDSVTIQKVVGISLASEDIQLVSVDNGTAAVAKAKEIVPDIVLADVVMPGLNGYEVCRQIKAEPKLQHVPVLLLTGTFEAFDEERASEAGSDGHITKPFEAQALVDLVHAKLAAAAPPAPAAPPEKSMADGAPVFGEEEPFDFMAEEVTEPSGVRAALASDALAFGDAEGLELEDSAEPLGRGMTQVEIEEADSGVAPLGEDDENAETLPPVAGDDEDELDLSPGTTRVLLSQPGGEEADAAEEDLAATRVLFAEPEAAGVGTIRPAEAGAGDADPFAESVDRELDVAPTDLGDPFSDEEAAPALAAGKGAATTVVISSNAQSAWARDEDDLFEAPRAAAAPAGGDAAPSRVPSTPATPSRDELHSLLEKVAWDAFGDVTDRIVRETVQRVEQIAWEVIPKMAETLIREEIRRLKEDDGK
jgi:CheY-like chemotaxis protein